MIEIPKKIFEIYNDCLGSNNVVVGRLFAAKIKNCYSEWLAKVGISIRYLSWLIKNRYTSVEFKYCKHCGKQLTEQQTISGGEYCCIQCRNKAYGEINKQVFREKYGVDNPSQLTSVKQKKRQTTINHYGVANPLQSEFVQQKIKQTIQTKYNSDHCQRVDMIRKQTIKTHRQHYYPTLVSKLADKQITLDMTKQQYVESQVLSFKCDRCGIQWQTEQSNPQKIYCPKCNQFNFKSVQEKQIVQLIKQHYDGTVIENDRSILGGKELDIWLPNLRLAIEYNGNYWHSLQFNNDIDYHNNKTVLCQSKSITLIHVFEYVWQIDSQLVTNVILDKLGCNKKSGNIRIQRINKHQAQSLFETYNRFAKMVGNVQYAAVDEDDNVVAVVDAIDDVVVELVFAFEYDIQIIVQYLLDTFEHWDIVLDGSLAMQTYYGDTKPISTDPVYIINHCNSIQQVLTEQPADDIHYYTIVKPNNYTFKR